MALTVHEMPRTGRALRPETADSGLGVRGRLPFLEQRSYQQGVGQTLGARGESSHGSRFSQEA